MIDTSFRDALAVAASRIAKIVVAFGTTYALVRWKIDLPPVLQTAFEQIFAAALTGTVLGTAAHFGVAIKTNPPDTVSPTEAKQGRARKRARKVTHAVERRIQQAGLADDDIPPKLQAFEDRHKYGPTEGE